MATTKTTTTKKARSAPTTDAFQEVRASIIRARAARADDVDIRDAALSFTFDLWKASTIALRVMRTSSDSAERDVRQAIGWTEFRQDELAREILGATPEAGEGRNIREAVLIEYLMDIVADLDWSEIDMLPAITSALEARRNELGLAPAANSTMAARKEPREAELMRAISTIGDILMSDGSMDAHGRIVAALRIVEQVEGTQSA